LPKLHFFSYKLQGKRVNDLFLIPKTEDENTIINLFAELKFAFNSPRAEPMQQGLL